MAVAKGLRGEPFTVRVAHLYPTKMNLYADRGNIAVLEQRLRWRGMHLKVIPVDIGDKVSPHEYDLWYLGGGQDRDQRLISQDLVEKGDAIRSAMEHGAAQLFVCGGVQLAGRGYTTLVGERLGGLGIFELDTFASSKRLIGDVVLNVTLDGETRQVVGYENHAGHTRLATGQAPFGNVKKGHGNNGQDGTEGAIRNRAIGTYLHGPLLPKNPWLADKLLVWALQYRYERRFKLEALDDHFEASAHRRAMLAADQPNR